MPCAHLSRTCFPHRPVRTDAQPRHSQNYSAAHAFPRVKSFKRSFQRFFKAGREAASLCLCREAAPLKRFARRPASVLSAYLGLPLSLRAHSSAASLCAPCVTLCAASAPALAPALAPATGSSRCTGKCTCDTSAWLLQQQAETGTEKQRQQLAPVAAHYHAPPPWMDGVEGVE